MGGKDLGLEQVQWIQSGGGGKGAGAWIQCPTLQGAEPWSGAQSGFAREENREEQMDPLFLGVRNLQASLQGHFSCPTNQFWGVHIPVLATRAFSSAQLTSPCWSLTLLFSGSSQGDGVDKAWVPQDRFSLGVNWQNSWEQQQNLPSEEAEQGNHT